MTHKQGTPEWEAERREYVGASEMGVILGMDPYRSEYELALLKKGLMEPEPPNAAMAWGHRVQRLALEQYAETTGHRVHNVNVTAASKRWPHVRASLDGRVVGQRRGVEVKLTRAWTEPPRRVVVQCQAQMAVANLDVVDVMRVGMGYGEPGIFEIEREDMAEELCDLAEAWYVRYVIGDELPPVDGSRGASKHLARLRGEAESMATDAQTALLGELHTLRTRMDTDKKLDRQIVNDLKASMAGTGILLAPTARVTWAATKGRTSTDWQAVAQTYGSLTSLTPEQLDATVERHTTTGEPSDRFAVKYTEGE